MFAFRSLIHCRWRRTRNGKFYNEFRDANSVGANSIGCETGSVYCRTQNGSHEQHSHITHLQNRKKVKLSCSWRYQLSSLLRRHNKFNWKWCHVLHTSKYRRHPRPLTPHQTAILTVCIWLHTGIEEVIWSNKCMWPMWPGYFRRVKDMDLGRVVRKPVNVNPG